MGNNNNIKKNFSVMLLGPTGAGKSSLINHLIGKEVASTNDIHSETQEATFYQLPMDDDILDIIDTRGFGESGKHEEVLASLKSDLDKFHPIMCVYLYDGSRRDGLDTDTERLYSLIKSHFHDTYNFTDLFFLVNKVDLLHPPGRTNLPANWYEPDTEKGKSIKNRIDQISRLINNHKLTEELRIHPVYLEWDGTSEPWNIMGVKNVLFSTMKEKIESRQSLQDSFVMGSDEIELLISLQVGLIENDIQSTKKEEDREKKISWKNDWLEFIINKTLPDLSFGKYYSKNYFENVSTTRIRKMVNKIQKSNVYRRKLALILLECTLFPAYIPLHEEKKPVAKIEESARQEKCKEYSRLLGFELDEMVYLQDRFKVILKIYKNYWEKFIMKIFIAIFGGVIVALSMGSLAPFIGGAIGGLMGLNGAVAVNAGLALLGGGSLAAGGFGMAGGVAIIMGGGGLLGLGFGSVASNQIISNLNPSNTMLNVIKQEIMFEFFILNENPNKREVYDFLKGHKSSLIILQNELKNNEKDEKLKESIKIMNKFLKRCLEKAERKGFVDHKY